MDKIMSASGQKYTVAVRYNSGGYGWIKRRIGGFNHAAKGMPYFVLTDLDRSECAPVLIRGWLGVPRHPNLLFRVAVREVESWLLGCRESFAAFLGVLSDRIPANVDEIQNPKEFVVSLARRSRRKDLRMDLVPQEGSTARVGPNYNGRLLYFVERHWEPAVAGQNSPSLRRTIEALETFRPVF